MAAAKRAKNTTAETTRPAPRVKPDASPPDEPKLAFASRDEWAAWLAKNHATARAARLVFVKKTVKAKVTFTYPEAVEVALAWGWIDGQSKSIDDSSWMQRFTPRTAKSIWSKINRDKALALIASGQMAPPGLAAVESAKRDGRWDAAYDAPSKAIVPEDLAAALRANKRAAANFEVLDRRNRYAILFRVQQAAKKPETRAARIANFVAMLARGETLYPQPSKARKPARRAKPKQAARDAVTR